MGFQYSLIVHDLLKMHGLLNKESQNINQKRAQKLQKKCFHCLMAVLCQ